MKRFHNFLKIIRIGLIISYLLVFVMYILTNRYFLSMLPFPFWFELKKYLWISLMVFSLVFFPIIVSWLCGFISKKIPRLIVTIMGILAFYGFFLAIYLSAAINFIPEYMQNRLDFNGHHYYLIANYDDFVSYRLYECNVNDLNCQIVMDSFSGLSYGENTMLITDLQKKLIICYRGNTHWSLAFTYGSDIRNFRFQGGVNNKDGDYSLYSYSHDDGRGLVITKCLDSKDPKTCEFLPFHYKPSSFNEATLIFDASLSQVEIYIDGILTYIYNGYPTCFTGSCETAING
jgi:hypothetical protein